MWYVTQLGCLCVAAREEATIQEQAQPSLLQAPPNRLCVDCRHLTDKRSVGGQVQPGSAQQSSPQIAAAVRQQQQPDALPTCTMEQLPPGGTAFNAAFNSAVNSPFNGCTMEQLPSGRHTASPSEAASPIQLKVFNSPATMLRHRQGNGSTPGGQQQQEQCRGEGVEQGQRVGVGQGLPGVGLFARNAAAAFCSARRQTLEPRNPYRLATTMLVNVCVVYVVIYNEYTEILYGDSSNIC